MELLRTVRLRPYGKGMGPVFTLRLYYLGGAYVGYTLDSSQDRRTVRLFEGQKFRPSPLHSIDSNESVRDLMGFLTLRPGDTDEEYFAGYTSAQLAYCADHAEMLGAEVTARFGEG